jgi:CRISPR/Cas system-associated exonuclease Cas4 (RecB family)
MSELLELQDLPQGYISYSQINMYKRCPMQYKFRYINGIKKPPKSFLIVGQSLHAGLTEGFLTKINQTDDTRKIMNIIVDKAIAELENLVSSQEIEYEEDDNKNKMKDDTAKMGKKYYLEVGKKLKPVEVKKQFEVSFENTDWKLKGEIDIVERDLIDWKTGKQKMQDEYILFDEQLKLYKLVVPKRTVIHQIVRYKVKEPEIFIFYNNPSEKEIQEVLKNCAVIVQLIRTGYFFKRNDVRYCSWCGYKDICQGG